MIQIFKYLKSNNKKGNQQYQKKNSKKNINEVINIEPTITKIYLKKNKNRTNLMMSFSESKILNFQSTLSLISVLPMISHAKLIYDTTENGSEPKDFHRCCDGITGTLVLIKSKNGIIAGGYTDLDWQGEGYKPSCKTFLFSVNNKRIYPIIKKDRAIYCNPKIHPAFVSWFISWFSKQFVA